MKLVRLELSGLARIELDVHGDARGFFVERFNAARFRELGVATDFVQDNHSRSAVGVVRGLHYQFDPPQAKFVGVTRGRVWDVVVDIRPDSPTFGRQSYTELTDLNGVLLWIPPGFAHGFCVLGDEPADVLYKVDVPWNPHGEGGIHPMDPELAIPWPVHPPALSTRDQNLPGFAAYRANPVHWNT
jgi:dTDP-4-dehydrorhamnose 3,5-epimerase